jgi:hypothetical protein
LRLDATEQLELVAVGGAGASFCDKLAPVRAINGPAD